MAAYRRVDGLNTPAGWLHVHRDQLQTQRSQTSMGQIASTLCKWRLLDCPVALQSDCLHSYAMIDNCENISRWLFIQTMEYCCCLHTVTDVAYKTDRTQSDM